MYPLRRSWCACIAAVAFQMLAAQSLSQATLRTDAGKKIFRALQGFGVQVSPLETGKPEFREALLEVLTNPKYTTAAQAMSAKIRARRNTPVQEAAGAFFLSKI